jgi:SAM-dependent methyltransferase
MKETAALARHLHPAEFIPDPALAGIGCHSREAVPSLRFETVPCDLCGGADFAREVTGVDWEFGGERCYEVVKCKSCGLAQQNPRPAVESVPELYPSSYGFYADRGSGGALSNIARRALARFTGSGQPYPHLASLPAGKILDVGCGTGGTLYPYGKSGSLLDLAGKGWRVQGCDISQEAAAAGRRRGLDIRVGRLPDLAYAENAFDVVRFNHVLEHSLSPWSDLCQARRIVKPGGLIVISVPNIESAAYALFAGCWSGLDLPRHFYFFSPASLRRYASRLEIELIADCTDSVPDDFVHSLRHFLHSGVFLQPDLTCCERNLVNEMLHGKWRVRRFISNLQPLIRHFNERKLGDNYTALMRKPRRENADAKT